MIGRPLRYRDLGAGCRAMLPTYPVFTTVLGVIYWLFTPEATVYAFAARIMPMDVWGWLFISIGVAEAGILVLGRSSFAFSLMLATTGMSMVIWTVVLAGAAITGGATASAWMWPAFVAQACRASARSIQEAEEKEREQ